MKHTNQQLLTEKNKEGYSQYKYNLQGWSYSRISIFFQDFAQVVIKKTMLNNDPTLNNIPGAVAHSLHVSLFDL